MLYKVIPGDGPRWEVVGPGVDPHRPLSFESRDIADRVAATLARAFVKGQEGVLASRHSTMEEDSR